MVEAVDQANEERAKQVMFEVECSKCEAELTFEIVIGPAYISCWSCESKMLIQAFPRAEPPTRARSGSEESEDSMFSEVSSDESDIAEESPLLKFHSNGTKLKLIDVIDIMEKNDHDIDRSDIDIDVKRTCTRTGNLTPPQQTTAGAC